MTHIAMHDAFAEYERSRGCIFGGAYGDMLGAAVEWHTLPQIRQEWGPKGILVPNPAYGRQAAETDDTQMARATARGIVNAPLFSPLHIITKSIYHEYLGWLESQNDPSNQRGPGSTCLSALRLGRMGTREYPINDGMGCGGVMRAHPIGIAYAHDPRTAFLLGMDAAAITHGHPNGYVPAGIYAALVALLVNNNSFDQAVDSALRMVETMDKEEVGPTLQSLRTALDTPVSKDPEATIDECIGDRTIRPGGWLGHDCLAIALYAMRCEPSNPLAAVTIAVNHSGDSDSTGSVVGALMGSQFGPKPFIDYMAQYDIPFENHEELAFLARRLHEISLSQ